MNTIGDLIRNFLFVEFFMVNGMIWSFQMSLMVKMRTVGFFQIKGPTKSL